MYGVGDVQRPQAVQRARYFFRVVSPLKLLDAHGFFQRSFSVAGPLLLQVKQAQAVEREK